ncbi:MAG TPA: 5'/3'-nucleotidase SurE [Candidatus Dormibacteraeota bacterium]|nr:5'/3'-nucleotidase SurE [Candidatus Dormibacteraeota bacterium]
MKILLSNDDGIAAEGLRTLISTAKALGEIVVVAPAGPQSGVSHTVTWEGAVRIESRAANEYAVHGTPADCTRLALLKLAPDVKWVLSGINHGANLGADVHYSGTVAAVREGVLHGWPGIAVSHRHRKGMEFDWSRAGKWVPPILADLMARPVESGLFYNVNLPHLDSSAPEPKIIWCPLDPNPLPLSYRHEAEGFSYDGDYQTRRRKEGTDLDVCFKGDIAITAIRLF